MASSSPLSSSLINLLDAPVDQLPGHVSSANSTPAPTTRSPPPPQMAASSPQAAAAASAHIQVAPAPQVAAGAGQEGHGKVGAPRVQPSGNDAGAKEGPKFDVTSVRCTGLAVVTCGAICTRCLAPSSSCWTQPFLFRFSLQRRRSPLSAFCSAAGPAICVWCVDAKEWVFGLSERGTR